MPTQPLGSSPNSSGFGLGLAPINQPFRTQGGRPGSLLLSPAPGADGQTGMGVPELSVIRVFAGQNLQSDATFKTVLLNSSTTSADLVRQAMHFAQVPRHARGGPQVKIYHSCGTRTASRRSRCGIICKRFRCADIYLPLVLYSHTSFRFWIQTPLA